ncbi:MAG TPA: hypothetical protein VN326_25510 [Casimicrobiaceae bacterium]|nr:hypothetical protein [Casimicrobiaceae bacterium]
MPFWSIADFAFVLHFVNYQGEEYQASGERYQEHYALFGGPVFLFIWRWSARIWHFIDSNQDGILAALTIGIFVVTALLAKYTYGLWTETKTLRKGADAVASRQAEDTRESLDRRPRTIHDFGGFPKPLHEVEYPAPGSPELAHRVRELLSPISVRIDRDWGLDDGTWSILVHMYPAADTPVVQLSIDETREASWHYEVAKQLQSLRDEGVLIRNVHGWQHSFRGARASPRVPIPEIAWPLAITAVWFGVSNLVAGWIAYPDCPELGAIASLVSRRYIRTRCGPWARLDQWLELRT